LFYINASTENNKFKGIPLSLAMQLVSTRIIRKDNLKIKKNVIAWKTFDTPFQRNIIEINRIKRITAMQNNTQIGVFDIEKKEL